MIIDCYDIETEPIINASDFYGEPKHLVDVCLILYSWEIQEHLLNTFKCEKIGELGVCNGKIPIYKINYKGKDVAFYLTGIGSAVASCLCYETMLEITAGGHHDSSLLRNFLHKIFLNHPFLVR